MYRQLFGHETAAIIFVLQPRLLFFKKSEYNFSDCLIYINRVPVFILLIHLGIFAWL